MPKQQDYGDKDHDALADYEGLEQWLANIWLEGEDDESEGYDLDGHIWLFRDFRGSGDPAVLFSETVKHAPELLELLAKTTAQLDVFLNRYGCRMADHLHEQGQKLSAEAAELVNKLTAFTPVAMPEDGDANRGTEVAE